MSPEKSVTGSVATQEKTFWRLSFWPAKRSLFRVLGDLQVKRGHLLEGRLTIQYCPTS
jgi:hypothetical protein